VALADRTVLVVDDSAADVHLIRAAFQKSGFNNAIHAVSDPEAALRFLKGEGDYADRVKFPFPHLIILDHGMPGDAVEVIRWVRRRPDLQFLAVVVFTGSANPDYEKEARNAGANAYHVKPQSFQEFVTVIKRIADFWLLGGPLPGESGSAPRKFGVEKLVRIIRSANRP
jgi:CheY-like chemotaxis protein